MSLTQSDKTFGNYYNFAFFEVFEEVFYELDRRLSRYRPLTHDTCRCSRLHRRKGYCSGMFGRGRRSLVHVKLPGYRFGYFETALLIFGVSGGLMTMTTESRPVVLSW